MLFNMPSKHDENFDKLSSQFRKNIYNTVKGKIRLRILQRDIFEQIPDIDLGGYSILDAGAGQGHFSLQLAKLKNKMTLCDLSQDMITQAEASFHENNLDSDARFIHSSVQDLSEHITEQFDIVLFHAVLEWLAEPEQVLKQLMSFIKPGGYLSLMFYSRTGLIYRNLTLGNFNYIIEDKLAGDGSSLTPTNPQDPEEVIGWLEKSDLNILAKSGVRVFSDGISRDRKKQIDEATLLDLEEKFSRKEPYCSLARYVHVLCQK
ncbi:MAG: methyltransferase domain-containing protein [Woeseiaceae bacterium]